MLRFVFDSLPQANQAAERVRAAVSSIQHGFGSVRARNLLARMTGHESWNELKGLIGREATPPDEEADEDTVAERFAMQYEAIQNAIGLGMGDAMRLAATLKVTGSPAPSTAEGLIEPTETPRPQTRPLKRRLTPPTPSNLRTGKRRPDKGEGNPGRVDLPEEVLDRLRTPWGRPLEGFAIATDDEPRIFHVITAHGSGYALPRRWIGLVPSSYRTEAINDLFWYPDGPEAALVVLSFPKFFSKAEWSAARELATRELSDLLQGKFEALDKAHPTLDEVEKVRPAMLRPRPSEHNIFFSLEAGGRTFLGLATDLGPTIAELGAPSWSQVPFVDKPILAFSDKFQPFSVNRGKYRWGIFRGSVSEPRIDLQGLDNADIHRIASSFGFAVEGTKLPHAMALSPAWQAFRTWCHAGEIEGALLDSELFMAFYGVALQPEAQDSAAHMAEWWSLLLSSGILDQKPRSRR